MMIDFVSGFSISFYRFTLNLKIVDVSLKKKKGKKNPHRTHPIDRVT